MSTVQDPRKAWLATGARSLLTVWWRMPVSGTKMDPCLPALAVACLLLPPAAGEGPVCSWLPLLWYLLNPLFCEWASLCVRLEPFMRKFFFFFFSFFPLWLSHSFGGYLTYLPQIVLRAFRPSPYLKHATHASLSRPSSLVADASKWATSPLGVAVRSILGVYVCVCVSSRLCCP